METTFKIKLSEVRVLLDLFMVSDPWPLSHDENEIIEKFLDRVAVEHGHETWVDMFHEKGE